MGKHPRNQKNHINIKKNEEHGGDIELNGVSGAGANFCGQTAFVGRVFDFPANCFLAKEMTASQDCNTDSNR